jgi:hypothetical protein
MIHARPDKAPGPFESTGWLFCEAVVAFLVLVILGPPKRWGEGRPRQIGQTE